MTTFTIPALARRLGVSSTTVRDWIERGEIEAPPHELPLSGESVYTSDEAERIEAWYLRRASRSRGPGAKERRQRAAEALVAPSTSAEAASDDVTPDSTRSGSI